MASQTTGDSGSERTGKRTGRFARRGLLRGLAAGTAGAALRAKAADAGSEARPAAAARAEGDHRRLGFQPTDHTRWFYHRARW